MKDFTSRLLEASSTAVIITPSGIVPETGAFTAVYDFGQVYDEGADIETVKHGLQNFVEANFKAPKCITLELTACGAVKALIIIDYTSIHQFKKTCPIYQLAISHYNDLVSEIDKETAEDATLRTVPQIDERLYSNLQRHLICAEAEAYGFVKKPANTNRVPRPSMRPMFCIVVPLSRNIDALNPSATRATGALRSYMQTLSPASAMSMTTIDPGSEGVQKVYHFTYNVERAPYSERVTQLRTTANINNEIQKIVKNYTTL